MFCACLLFLLSVCAVCNLFSLTGGGGCTAYDVIVHTDFITKLQTSDLFQTFFLTVVCEGIEEKYEIELERGKANYILLMNRTCMLPSDLT